jgi:hypothetical protein
MVGELMVDCGTLATKNATERQRARGTKPYHHQQSTPLLSTKTNGRLPPCRPE